MNTIGIKPLSVNVAFKGQRFKTDEYKKFQRDCLLILPCKKEVKTFIPYKLNLVFGVSSILSDVTNCIKIFEDILVKKYGIDDRYCFEANQKKVLVEKGKEFISFEFIELPKKVMEKHKVL